MTKMQIKGTIYFTVDKDHPDYKYMSGDKTREMSFDDTYTFDIYDPVDNPSGYWEADQLDGMHDYIRNDLALIAGGGSDTKHIHNVRFVFSR